jgi:hypothetical protein
LRLIDYDPSLKPPYRLVQRHRQLWDAGGWGAGPNTSDTAHYSAVFAADTDGDGNLEIMTGGRSIFSSRSSTITRAQLKILSWNKARNDFSVEHQLVWTPRPFGHASVDAVWAADVDNDGQIEIVCGGTAWHEGPEGNSAWIGVFDHRLRLMGYRTWPFYENFFGYLADLAASNLDGSPDLELVTLTATMSSPSFSHAPSIETELTAWKLRLDDSGLRFFVMDRVNWNGPRRWVRPTSLWVGEMDREKGIEIVTGGCHRLASPFEDDIATDIRLWRFTGGRFTKQQDFEGFIFTSEDDIPLHLSDCRSVYGADINGDGFKELLFVNNMAGTNDVTGGHVAAIDPNVDLMNAHREDIFKRSLTFGVDWHDDSPVYLWNDTISAADLVGDGRVKTVVSGTFTHRPENRGIVFVFE